MTKKIGELLALLLNDIRNIKARDKLRLICICYESRLKREMRSERSSECRYLLRCPDFDIEAIEKNAAINALTSVVSINKTFFIITLIF